MEIWFLINGFAISNISYSIAALKKNKIKNKKIGMIAIIIHIIISIIDNSMNLLIIETIISWPISWYIGKNLKEEEIYIRTIITMITFTIVYISIWISLTFV